MRFCLNRGYVVPADGLIGPEPFDFQFRSMAVNVGCNHLVCGNCKSPVRQQPGYTSDTYINRDVAKLAVAADWQPFIGSAIALRADARLYLCQCEAMTVTRAESLEPDPDDPYGARPWQCGGHPAFRLPAVLDGVTLSSKSDFAALARRYFGDELASHPAVARWQGDWLNRVYQLISPNPEAEQLAEAVLGLVVSDDVRVAIRAIAFFATNPEAHAADSLLAKLDEAPSAFARENSKPAKHSLRYWLLQSVGSRLKHVGAGAVSLPRAKELALASDEKPDYFLDALVALDPVWVASKQDALRAANPSFHFSQLG